MAISSGRESKDVVVKRYIGVAPVFVLTVNPTKTELEKIYETDIDNTPEYLGEAESEDGTKIPQVRIDFIVRTDPDKCNGIDMKTKISFFVKKAIRYTKDGAKVQVVNKYGEFVYIPIDDAKEGRVPESLNWFEAADYRPAFVGEEELSGFIKAYLNIPNKSYRNKNGEVVELKDKSEAEARLDKILDYFKGEFSELKVIPTLQPKNKVKAMFGVKTTDENKQYQAVYTHKFLKNGITDYSKLDAEYHDKQANGAYKGVEFSICELKEYMVEATDFSSTDEATPMPFESTATSPWFGK